MILLKRLYVKQIESDKMIAHDMNEYKRRDLSDPKRTYQWLYEAVENALHRRRVDRNRKLHDRSHGGRKGLSAAAVDVAFSGYGKPRKDRKRGHSLSLIHI